MSHDHFMHIGLSLAISFALVAPVAQPDVTVSEVQPSSACVAADPAAVEQFFADRAPDLVNDPAVPGFVVSVVDDGQMVFSGGYGTAVIEDDTSFDPDRSLVRIASITKLFTWTAVMQQVSAGRIDLGADINTYLDFHIPDTYSEPITMLDLMNHTAGFEEQLVGTGAESAADVPPLGDYLAANIPARIRPPGEVPAYSNYGAALAGYVVQRVSSEPWDRYITEHILNPLGMDHTTATEPVPDDLISDLAASYLTESDTPERVPFWYDPMSPDGAISTTATDMAAFMVAHLRGGTIGDGAILDPATTTTMHASTFLSASAGGGWAHGFGTRFVNGHQVLEHDGGWEAFGSELLLVPDCSLGLFISTNGSAAGPPVFDLVSDFMDEFVPAQPVEPDASILPVHVADLAPGVYIPTRHTESTYERVLSLFTQAPLRVGEDGSVDFLGEHWSETDGLLTSPDGSNHLVGTIGSDGTRYALTDQMAWQRIGFGDRLAVSAVILALTLLATLSTLTVTLVARLRRQTPSGIWRSARWITTASLVTAIAFLAGMAGVLYGSGTAFVFGTPPSFLTLLAVPLYVAVGTFGGISATVVGWESASKLARAHQIALLTALVGFIWFTWQWNLLGWQLP